MAPEFRQHYRKFEGYDRIAALSKRWIEITERRKAEAEKPQVPAEVLILQKAEEDHPLKTVERPWPHFRLVIRRVSAETGVQYADIVGRSRTHRIVAARFRAIAAVYEQCRDATGARLSKPAVARIFGGRDHTTILYALRKSGVK
jgi:predicted GTPase